MKYHKLVFYKNYFEDFLDQQCPKVRQKIMEILKFIEAIQMIPEVYMKENNLTIMSPIY